jgi:hypothetical protein
MIDDDESLSSFPHSDDEDILEVVINKPQSKQAFDTKT